MQILWKFYVYSLFFRLGKCYPAVESSGSTPLTSSKTLKEGLDANEFPDVVESSDMSQNRKVSDATQHSYQTDGANVEDTLAKGFERFSGEQHDHPHAFDLRAPISVSRPSTIEEVETITAQPEASTNCFNKAWRNVCRVASKSLGPLWERTKALFSKVFDFFRGKRTEADTPSGIAYGSPKEEGERNAIVRKFIGAAGTLGEAAPDWFKELETSFRTLPKISETRADHKQFKQTKDLIHDLVKSLVTMPLSLQQREVIMSAINHITSYNPSVKDALYRAALGKKHENHVVFKALALTISDIRPGHLPDASVKHSFEADWFKTPEVEERYHRIILVDSQPKGLSPEVKRLAEQLEHCPNVHQWAKDDNKDFGGVKVIMMTAIRKIKDFQDPESEEDLTYTYKLIQYIANVNKHAKAAFEKELLDEEVRQPVVKALVLLYSDRLFENIMQNSLEMKILSDPTLGPLMDRTFLQQTIPKNSMPEEIKDLTNRILGLESKLKTWAPDPTSSNSVQEILNRLLLLMTPKPGEELKLRFPEKNTVIDLLAYLDRWNPFVRVEIRRHLYANPSFLKVLSSIICKYYPDGVLETASKTTFYYKLLEGTTLAERVSRERLVSLAMKTQASELIAISSPLERLENGWYTDAVDNQPQKMAGSLLDLINRNKWKAPKSPVIVSIRMLQHLTYYKSDLKKSVLTEINDQTKLQLRINLRLYCQETQTSVRALEGVFTRVQRGYTHDFVEWLKEIPIMNDLQRDTQPQSTTSALLKQASNHLKGFSSQISRNPFTVMPAYLGGLKQMLNLGPLKDKLVNVVKTIQQKSCSYSNKLYSFFATPKTGKTIGIANSGTKNMEASILTSFI